MPIDLNAGNTQGTQTPIDSSYGDKNLEGIKATTSLSINDGIEETSEIEGGSRVGSILNGKNVLQPPTSNLDSFLDETITLNPEMQKILGVEAGSMPFAKFMATCIKGLAHGKNSGAVPGGLGGSEKDSEDSGEDLANLKFDLDEMSGEDIAMLCLLLCQTSKSQMVEILKNTLDAKTKERQKLNNSYLDKQKEIAAEQVKLAKEVAKTKKLGILKAVFSAVFAVVAAVISVAVVVATAGAGAVLVCAALGAAFSCLGAEVSVVSSGITIAALTTENQEKAEKLNKASAIVGYVGAGVSILGAACSAPGAAVSIARAAMGVKQVVSALDTVSSVAQTAEGLTTAGLAIGEAVENIKVANIEKEMANIKIEMTKLDGEIEFLGQFLDQLDEFIQMFIKSMLECEQMGASELGRMMDNRISLAAKI